MKSETPLWRRYIRFLGSDVDGDVDDELRFHLAMREQEFLESGMSAGEARRAAHDSFGDYAEVRRWLRHHDRGLEKRRAWTERLGAIVQDIRLGARRLARQPGFTAITALNLALGIGATVAVLSLVQGVLLTPPPYEEPDELTLILPAVRGGASEEAPAWTAEQWLLWQDESRLFESIGAYRWTFAYVVSDEGSESIKGMWVTRDYFRTLGIAPALGRVFDETETGGEGAPRAIILGHDFWMERYGGDPTILGQTIRISRQDPAPTVVGVMPPGVRFLPSPARASEPGYDADGLVDYWMPMQPSATSTAAVRQQQMWNVVGRLADTVDLETAGAEIGALVQRQAEVNPAYEGMSARVESLPTFINREGRRLLLPLLIASLLVLLIACGNAAALLLVRGLQNGREYSVRGAVGASRGDLIRLVTVESLLLAIIGGALGAGLATGVVAGFKAVAGSAIPRLDAVLVGWPLLSLGLGCAVLAAVASSLYPAIRASRSSPSHALGEAGARTSVGRRDRRMLAGVASAQAALTLTLLVGAGLMMRTMTNLAAVESGYDTQQIMTMAVTAFDEDWDRFHSLALERVKQIPGVEGVAFAWGVPLTGEYSTAEVVVEGQAAGDRSASGGADNPSVPMRGATSGYFALLGMSILEGRDFRPMDDMESEAVAIVNESFVDRHILGGAAVGRTITLVDWGDLHLRIVGVVSDGRTDDLTRAAQPEVYSSMWQVTTFTKHLVVRTAGNPADIAVPVQQALREVEPTVAVEMPRTLEQIRRESLSSTRFAMQLLVGFGLVACFLTLAGIYGVLSLSVASRRRELAIRTAVGATRAAILRTVIAEGARVTVVGVVGGVLASIALARLLGSFLYGVEPTDPLTLLVMGSVVAAIALLASWFPARRAADVDLMRALGEE